MSMVASMIGVTASHTAWEVCELAMVCMPT